MFRIQLLNMTAVVQVKRLDDLSPGIRGALYYLAHKAAESPGKVMPSTSGSNSQSNQDSIVSPISSNVQFLDPMLSFLRPKSSLLGWYWMLVCIRVRAAVLDLDRGEGAGSVWSWEGLGVRKVLGYGRTGTVFEGRIFGQRVAVKVGEHGDGKVGKGVDVEEEMGNEIDMYNLLQVCNSCSRIFKCFSG